MSSSSSPAGVAKKSAFSCEPCRKRKVKCGGEQPSCRRCAGRAEPCVYKLNPTLSYTQRLESRIRELEDQVATLQKELAQVASVPPPPPHPAAPPPPAAAPSSLAAGSSPRTPSDAALDDALAGSFSGLTVDENGVITYHGSTSFFQLPGENEHPPPASVAARSSQSPGPTPSPQAASSTSLAVEAAADSDRRERLVTNAWQQRALEDLSATPEPFQYLLKIHWCWIQPLFNFIYRPAFTRDMQVLGPYYSHTLMNAVLSHSVRWAKSDPATRRILDARYEGGALFGRHARVLVFDELSRGVATIPTVQTLLLLSAQECSLGNSAQAYVYSGIAFRLIDHLGICVDGARYAASVRLSDEDIEIRNRLFWSCYFWDKIICLYLGRSPALQHSPVSPPQIILDDSSETDLWVPFGLESSDFAYPPTAAHSTSCFTRVCRLAVIFNQILIHMYDPLGLNTEGEMLDCFARQEGALNQWWDELPAFLRIDTAALPALAPPSHVVTLNCLYHTFRILLYRPMLSKRVAGSARPAALHASYLLQCVSSATSVIAIFDLFCRSFGYRHCVLSLSYSVYIAASIFLLQVQAHLEDSLALQRLAFCIYALDRVQSVNRVIGSALNLIHRELARLGIDVPSSSPLPSYLRRPEPSSSPSGLAAASSVPSPPTTYPLPNEPLPFGQPVPVPSYDQQQQQQQQQRGSWFGAEAGGGAAAVADAGAGGFFEMTPELFEAVSSIEPLSVRVGALDGFKM